MRSWLRRAFLLHHPQANRQVARRRKVRPRLLLEVLEDRFAPAVFSVTTAADNGNNAAPTTGSLREALLEANAALNTSAPDAIVFSIPAADSHTIHPPTPLPAITDPVIISGSSQLSLGGAAIEITGDLAPQGTNGLTLTAGNSTIQGLTINGFTTGVGILLSGAAAANNTIAGNFLGTDVTGTSPRPNATGLALRAGANNNQIGGLATDVGAANVISGNTGDGIVLQDAGTSANIVSGNLIGVDSNGAAALGNGGAGVAISGDASGNTIGGADPAMGNTIANNAPGIGITGNASVGNQLLGNSIYANAGLGIDLGNDGATANGVNPRPFPNGGQNAPIVLTAFGTTVSGVFTSQAQATYRLEFFATAGASGHGQSFLGAVDVTTDATGNASFLATVSTVPAGSTITATATNNTTGNTSEFSTTAAVNQRFVGSLYVDLLGRAVDVGGLAYWTNYLSHGGSRLQFALGLEHTSEFWGRQVDVVYAATLHRAADPAGRAAFVSLLMHGSTIEQAKAVLLGSQEYFTTRGGGSNGIFLNALYQDALGRPIDSGAMSFFSQQLQRGMTRTQVAYAVVASAEAYGLVIDAAYLNLLHRAADPGGRAAFVNLLQHGVRDEFILALFAASDEYFSHV